MEIVPYAPGIAAVRAECVRWRDHIAEEVLQDARRFSPKRTGRMLATIHRRGNKVVVRGGWYRRGGARSGTFYWFFNEYGTRYMAAQPFMRPALYRRR